MGPGRGIAHSSQFRRIRPISLTSLVMKIFEKCLRDRLYEHCKSFITTKQHGFLPERSCNTQMLNYTDTLALYLNEQSQTDVIYFDFSKAFESRGGRALTGWNICQLPPGGGWVPKGPYQLVPGTNWSKISQK